MDLNITFPTITKDDSYYLLSSDLDGNYEVQIVEFETIGQSTTGITKPTIVMVNGEKGFRKDSRKYDDGDDLEFLVNAVGRCLDIPVAKEYRVLDRYLERDSFLSMNVASTEKEVFCEMSKITQKAANRVLKNKEVLQQWMIDWGEVTRHPAFPDVKDNYEYLCEEESTYDLAINFPVYVVEYYFGKDTEAAGVFRKRYFEMLMFDLLIGQTDRTMENYGILMDVNETTCSLAALFDCATLAKPYLPGNIYALNSLATDRETLFRLLAEKYPKYIMPVADRINQRIPGKFSKLTEFAEIWIENENKDRLIENIKYYFEMAKKYLGEEYGKIL